MSKVDILFKSPTNDIKISSKNKIWIYVVMIDQWEIIKQNIQKQKKYLCAYSGKNIGSADIILIYLKPDKGTKKVNKESGFIALAQVKTDMEKNTDDIKIFNDNNLNRYILELSIINIFNIPFKIGLFNDLIIEQTNNKIKGAVRFAITMMKGEFTFSEITHKNLGIEIIKYLYELISANDPKDIKSDNESDNESEEKSDNESDNESESEKSSSKKIIKQMIPVMMIVCQKLKKILNNSKNKTEEKTHNIIIHYKNCDKCEITNNNTHEIYPTLKKVNINNIKFIESNYDKILKAYHALEEWPNINKTKTAKTLDIKIYFMKDNIDYKSDILICYNTLINEI